MKKTAAIAVALSVFLGACSREQTSTSAVQPMSASTSAVIQPAVASPTQEDLAGTWAPIDSVDFDDVRLNFFMHDGREQFVMTATRLNSPLIPASPTVLIEDDIVRVGFFGRLPFTHAVFRYNAKDKTLTVVNTILSDLLEDGLVLRKVDQ